MISSFRGFYFILQNVNRQDALLFSEGAYEIASIVTDDIYQDISLFLLQKKKKQKWWTCVQNIIFGAVE